ncbi:claspin-like [Ctenocephalides felis]|uniref:claspin-like n=1 Tax=Ctenocephalides felis TaxID=7515 RepID=UPI000E6E5494|nr:claspin-like [Ctenocephalides felis]
MSLILETLETKIGEGATEDKADGIVVVNPDEMEANKTNLVPGLALQKLRNELQFRMAQRRSEEFNKRLKQQKVEKTGYESDILDDKLHENEDELELELSSSEDEIESEVEKTTPKRYVDYILLCLDKDYLSHTLNSFNSFNKHMQFTCKLEEILVEDLADVAESQEEEEEEKIETSGKEQNEEELEYDEDAHVSEADDENSESENSSDSESENNENCMNKNDDTSKKIRKRIQVMNSSDSEVENEVEEDSKKRESIDLFQTQNEDEIIPLHQTKLAEPQTTPQYKCHNSSKDSELKLSSPTWLTENTQMTPIPQIISDTQCSIASADNQAQNSSAVKRLFLESTESTQHNNPFLSTQNELASLKCAEDELLELCSGQFPTQVSSKQNENNDTEEPQSNIKLCLSDENSISDVLNTVENNEVIGEKKLKRKKKKITTKPLQFSDDEESDEENDEENDFEDEEIEDVMQEEAEKIYEYDSEENEVEIIADKKKQQKYVEREFFENEAELSDSEWGSADEDERGLDIYDKELGDEDHIDTIKVRGELERIHMRQVLDEDKRDVRILQEMLLEDGENHGDATRERKFRWKNAGEGFSLDEKTEDQKTDEQVSEDEDQTEWRKNRFEREKVLREKQMQIEEISDSSTLLTDTLLSETLSEKKTKLTVRKPILEQVVTVGKEECFFSMGSALKSNRGSFLKRDEATLSRLSALTKINVDDPDGSRNLGSSGKGNFVFATLSPAPEKLSIEEKTKKRAPTEDLSSISKKVKKTTVNKKLLLDFLE